MAQSPIVFITGGVRSGKSTLAEELACLQVKESGGDLHYIACGQPSDQEMKKRIKRHQLERQKHPYAWKVWECSVQIGMAACHFKKSDVIVLDCLTTLVNNELFYSDQMMEENNWIDNLKDRIINDLEEIRKHCGYLIIVSNEILNEPIKGNKMVKTYAKILGELHQSIVVNASHAILVEAGLPMMMKGDCLWK